MEIFRSEDGLVGKYLHEDGSETAVKCVSSCDTVRDPATGRLHVNPVERNKFSIFASASSGCVMKCSFCYLTTKKAPYVRLEEEEIFANLSEAVRAERSVNPGISSRWAKICWMGMGEDHMLRSERTRRLTHRLMAMLMEEESAAGLDGCDLATVLPPGLDEERWFDDLAGIDSDLAVWPLNPNNAASVHSSNGYAQGSRTRTRLFWSLHSADPKTRSALIPHSRPPAESAAVLRRFREKTGLNLIVHHFFLDGVNDTPEEVEALIRLLREEGLSDCELRVLRYNSCINTPHKEAERFDGLVARLAEDLPRLKVQISTGSEVKAACGQFIVKAFADPDGWRAFQEGRKNKSKAA